MRFWGTVFYFSGFIAIVVIVLMAYDPKDLNVLTLTSKPQKIAVKIPQDLKVPEVVETPKASSLNDLSKPEPMAIAVESFKTFQGSSAGSSGFSSAEGEPTRALLSEIRHQSRPPQVSQRKAPEYPDQAKRQNLEGFVLVKILVGASGELVKSEIIESEPQGVFDRSVLDSLSTWKFVPGLQKGEQVAMWLTQKVRFQLD